LEISPIVSFILSEFSAGIAKIVSL